MILDLRAARAGSRLFHLRERRSAGAVRRGGGAGRAGHAVSGAGEDQPPHGSGRACARGGPGSRIRRRTDCRRAVDRRRRGAREPAEGELREATTEPLIVSGANAPVIDTVTVGVADSAVRLREAQNAFVTSSRAGAGRARRIRRARAPAKRDGRAARLGGLRNRPRHGPRRDGKRSTRLGSDGIKRSSTLPASVPAGTIFGCAPSPHQRSESSGSTLPPQTSSA